MADLALPARYDLQIRQGCTYQRAFTWTIPDDDGVQQPVDLTGCTVRGAIRRRAADVGDPVAELAFTVDGPAGTATLTIPAEDTSTDLHGDWDARIEWPGGDITPFLYGDAQWEPAATR